MKKLLSLSLIIFLSAGFLTSCKKNNGDPPVLPPIGTMKIDFSDFTTGKKSAEITESGNEFKSVENVNYKFASSVAGFWNSLLTINLVVPVASFAESFNHSPVYLDNKTWQWTYNVNVLAGTYKARLTGQISDSIKWKMYISKEGVGAFSEFLWFEGTSALDGNSGKWILNSKNDASVSEKLLQINWTIKNDIISSVKYTYIKADQSAGSYIEYGLKDASLNAFYNVHIYESTVLKSFADIFIEWSTTNHNGHVKAFYKYSDNNWHCWDSNGNDVLCN